MEMYFIAVLILAGLAVSDLIVGVSNDAVNFLNSSIGSRVAPRYIILAVATLGMLAGVMFSKGMMEVARKGIFHPKLFNMPELMVIFLAVMLTDVLLLDFYNTFGLPTSTTVSIVFELLGAAVVVSLIKISQAAESFGALMKYINTAKALAIISGILLSVVIAFICGAIVQFFTRLLFTFDFRKQLKRYGALWGGFALAVIVYFILIKGAKGSTFISPEALAWIKANTWTILLYSFLACVAILLLLQLLSRINILKPIVLIGTFALAMAFAANDLVNFIGVPLAGMSTYEAASAGSNPLTMPMEALQKATPSHTFLLLLAGVIMGITLWVSKKARTVTETEINLSRQDEGYERFGSSSLSRSVVRMVRHVGEGFKMIVPNVIMNKLNKRFEEVKSDTLEIPDSDKPSFDLVRASVNLMVAGALISLATSMKLPLSTTYVTFMVAMGTSFADRAWGRDSAVYRITGVFAVIGGWFLTALTAFTVAGIFALVVFYLRVPGVFAIMIFGALLIVRNRRIHKNRVEEVKEFDIFNLKKITDGNYAIKTTFEHAGYFLKEVAKTLEQSYEGLAKQDRSKLKAVKRKTKKIQEWANIITANVFKTLRLLQREETAATQKYTHTISSLQEIAECHRDAVMRAYTHIDNNHKGMLDEQLKEMEKVKNILVSLLEKTAAALEKHDLTDSGDIIAAKEELQRLVEDLDGNQAKRIQDDTSKTRLSILFYGFLRDSRIIAEQTAALMEVFKESFKPDGD
ncbi:MAG: inorganic phosphate transporter [bacterium]|nr:inorganic phosphate transporter [bacterium]